MQHQIPVPVLKMGKSVILSVSNKASLIQTRISITNEYIWKKHTELTPDGEGGFMGCVCKHVEVLLSNAQADPKHRCAGMMNRASCAKKTKAQNKNSS